MAASSITKEFYVKDRDAFERLKQALKEKSECKQTADSPSLKRGREKLTAFVFR